MSIPFNLFITMSNMIMLKNGDLPEVLTRLHDPVKNLFVSGENLPELMSRPRIGIVGSRKITPYGRGVTANLATELANKGVVVISGLAIGVDSTAHSAVVQAGGQTIAVLPSSVDDIYPRTHAQLADEIVEKGGLLVSEYPSGTPPMQHRFIERNRIIAALSDGLLLTEAAIRSGSLHTARFALELGIPVFAVPGPITSPTSEGTNNLIKTGAIPVTSVDDILNAMNWKLDKLEPADIMASTDEERVILELLSRGLSDGNIILAESGLEVGKFNQVLTMLEITGRIRPLGANHWTIS